MPRRQLGGFAQQGGGMSNKRRVEPVCQSCNKLRGPAIPLYGQIRELIGLPEVQG